MHPYIVYCITWRKRLPSGKSEKEMDEAENDTWNENHDKRAKFISSD